MVDDSTDSLIVQFRKEKMKSPGAPSNDTDSLITQFRQEKNKPPAEPMKGIGSRLNEDLVNRGLNIRNELVPSGAESLGTTLKNSPERALRTTGQAFGLIGDVATEAGKSIYSTVVPTSIQETIKEGIRQQMQSPTGAPFVQGVSQAKQQFEQQHPDITKDIAAASNILGVVGAKKLLQSTGDTLADSFMKGPKAVFNDIDKEIEQTIEDGFTKAVKPRIGSIGTTGERRSRYLENATNSTLDIVNNKTALTLTDNSGKEVIGQIPQSAAQQLEATEQRMQNIFTQYDKMKKQAGEAGAMVELKPYIEKTKEMIAETDKSTVVDPATKRFLKVKLEQLQKIPEGKITVAQAQKDLAELNAKLKPGYAKVGYKDIGSFHSDALQATFLRQGLDDAITKEAGPGYQALKNQYSAHRAVQEDIARRVNQISGTPPKGLIDLSDVWIGYHAMYAGFTGNLASLGAAGIADYIKKRIKSLRDPDVKIRKMFEKVDNLNTKKTRIKEILDKHGINTTPKPVQEPLPEKAKGGPVQAGKPVIVGEKGPEVFVPAKDGKIIPNKKALRKYKRKGNMKDIE